MDLLNEAFENFRQLGIQVIHFVIFLIYMQFEGFRLETLMTSGLPQVYLILSVCLVICRIYFIYRLLCVLADTLGRILLILLRGKLRLFLLLMYMPAIMILTIKLPLT